MTTPVIISILALAVSVISVSAMIFFNSKNSKHTDEKDLSEEIKEKMEELKERERERAKDIEERTRQDTIINVKLDNINSSNREIKDQIFSLSDKVDSHGDRIIKVEESCKQAHHRLDTIENRLNKEEDE